MISRTSIERDAGASSLAAKAVKIAVLFLGLLLFPALGQAQQPPVGTVGRVEGEDISVDEGYPANVAAPGVLPSIYVTSGSAITVHSGRARLLLAAGGQISICGPAKFTLLQSSGAITLALNFGRLHLELPSATALRIFTPTIVATPLDIAGGPLDTSVGLDLHDTLCVLPTRGALRVEHQFTGEGLIVPQGQEFYLSAGKLLPVAGPPGSCRCEDLSGRGASTPPAPVPETALATKLQPPAPAPAPAVAPEPAAISLPATLEARQPPEPRVEFSVPAHPNAAHPNPPASKNSDPPPPPAVAPEWKVIMPPLTFFAASPDMPPDPSPDMILLVRVARDEPDWVFHARVEGPSFEKVSEDVSAKLSAGKRVEHKEGFWSKLKRLFVGSPPRNLPKPCGGIGCG